MEEKAKSLEIKIEPDVAQGKYSNLVAIAHQDSNFIFDFIFIEPQGPVGRVFSRVITSPQHAKRLLKALEENISKYEAHYGNIQIEQSSQQDKQGMNYLH